MQAHVVEQPVLEIYVKPYQSEPDKYTEPCPINFLDKQGHDKVHQCNTKHDESDDGQNIKPNAIRGRDWTKQIIVQRIHDGWGGRRRGMYIIYMIFLS